MKLSRNFLNDYVNTKNITNEELADKMTSVGNECDSISEICPATNIVVGKVLTCEMHPDSDHLHVCTVDTKDEVRTIVCGAPNVKANIKVIVALPGANLPAGTIKSGKIRGVLSDGMICSLDELGLDQKYVTEEDKKGIHILPDDAEVGMDAKEYLGFNDTTIDFDLTPNRSDLLSIIGMAYEVGAILNEKVNLPKFTINNEVEDINKYMKLSVKTDKCPLYLIRMVKDIKIKESPKFIKERLMASGMRPINNVVDISNYVMLEYGQPLHFFDYKTLGNEIIVRMANDNEKITTLDNNERTLTKDDIVITNPNGPVCLAGVMGGINSEIEETTKDVVIEAALFHPTNVRKTSRRILMSEASTRFEHGINPEYTNIAIDRACYLLEKYADAKVIKGTISHNKLNNKPKKIEITKEKIEKILGLTLTNEDILDVFNRLDFKTTLKDNTFIVDVSTRRLDISIPEDLIEEVGRIHGINNIIGKLPEVKITPGKRTKNYQKEVEFKDKLMSLGLTEVITYSLINEENANRYNYENKNLIKVLKPLSEDKKILRPSLIPSLYEVYNYNYSRSIKDINIFEISNVYYYNEENEVEEQKKLTILISGIYNETKWLNSEIPSDFYTLKGIVSSLLDYAGLKNRYLLNTDNIYDFMHPYQSANIILDKNNIGFFGKLNKNITKKDIYVCEINLNKVFNINPRPIKNKEITKYPEIKKDVAFIIDKNITSEEIIKVIKKAGTNLLKNIDVFDLYEGNHIANDKKQIAYSLTFSSLERTLSEEEVDKLFRNIIEKVNTKFNATIRDK